ncbi:MAG TPA: response regulator [Pseudomonas xinjiangensis]|uniref:Response regulator n=2 Tax=root TaxID=1 RepID=A0A7V1FTU2_9GAMM|nr:response regulator [Halopseudomonas xinjiangensis]HEC46985.1 response regulator [Halopseudomonas xinjiangensis]
MPKPPNRSANVPQNRPDLRLSDLPFPVVGIGASAGGLQAVLRFFEHMPNDSGMAFVIILHLSPKHVSNAGKIIQGVTKMPVLQVTQPVPVEKNCIFVISPGQDLSMTDGYLRVSDPKPKRGGHVSIDLFFRTLADVHKERAFCLVLSGTGSDGAVGLSRIKEQGGVTLAQALDDAEYSDMPRSAIATGMVDLVLPVVEMPQKLMDIWQNARNICMPTAGDPEIRVKEPTAEDDIRAAEKALRNILALLFSRTGHNFKHYKRATVLRRIERRMQVNAQPDLASYLDFLQKTPQEAPALLGDMLIGVTNFFRDRECFEALERDVIPELFKSTGQYAEEGVPELRVWSAGCSTGEEAYSLAMLLNDQSRLEAKTVSLQVFATDIDERAIAVGRTGTYPDSILTDITPTRLREYFIKSQNTYQVRKEIREKVLFAQHSLLRDPPFSRLNLITCRNLLIYLDREVQKQILQMFHFALRPGGYLFLGSSESVDLCTDLFAPIDKKNRIFRAKVGPASMRPLATTNSSSLRQHLKPERAQPSGELHRRSFADIHQRVLEQYAPPSVIVNTESDIVHMSDQAGHFLRYVGGEPSHNLLALVRPELRLELRSAMFQAVQSGKSVETRRVKLHRDNRAFYVNMIARPFHEKGTGSDFVLVLFDEVEDTLGSESSAPHDQIKDSVLSQLEEELQRTKLQLQNTIEQSRVSTEELKASNEELRSATEELETSKEELQSINEELITVNHELKVKVEETDKVNDDLQNLIASSDIATVFVDRGMRIKWFTPRATSIFSMLPVDAGRSLLDITHRLEYDELANDAARVFESLMPIEREVRDNDNHCYLSRMLPYRTSEDHIEGAVLTFIDITARRAAEGELRLGEERMRMVAESAIDYAIIVQDTQGVVTSWNKGAELIFGFSREEAVGQLSDMIFVPEDREAGLPEEELRRAREHGRAEDERWHQRKDGSRFYCSGVVNVLDADSFRGYVKIARDLTERQQLADTQQLKLAETQSASQLKDEFFAVMSHELKHPLNLIQLNAELLGRLPVTKGTPMVSKSVKTIQHAVRSQARIIDDLLDVSRLRTGKMKLHHDVVDLAKVLRGICNVVKADETSAPVILEISEPESQRFMLNADPTRIEQVVWNLLNNALKFTPPTGEVRLKLTAEGQFARLEVSDTGQGIAPEFIDKVFDLFGQGETQHARLHREGLGIGLSLVRQLTEAHGGRVEVSSEGIGQGSCFTLWLPIRDSEQLQLQEVETLELAGRLQGLRVLLVDDSAEVLEVMDMLLEAEGAEVASFTSAADAIESAKTSRYDLIISDIGMPQMDGYQLIRLLREIPALSKVPAIAMSGYTARTDVQKALESGFNQHLAKPVTYDGLIDVIHELKSARSGLVTTQ